MSHPNPFADGPLKQGPTLQVVDDFSNPYASPATTGYVNQDPLPYSGLWRDGEYLVMHERATFPARCLITGEPTNQWNRQIVVCYQALATRFPTVEYGLSVMEKRRIWWRRLLALVSCLIMTCLLAIGVVILSHALEWPAESGEKLASIILLASGLLCIYVDTTVGRLLGFETFDRGCYWLSGAGPPFLNSLPVWPGNPSQS